MLAGLAGCGRKGTIADLKPPPPPHRRRRRPRQPPSERAFRYLNGTLHADAVPLAAIAAAVGTPCYVYSASAMRERAAAFRDAFAAERALLCYAVKANSNLAVIRLFANEGLGADTVSGGEIARALKAGVPPQRIVYAGIAKTDDEIRFALATGILQFNVESTQELRRIGELGGGVVQDLGLRFPGFI